MAVASAIEIQRAADAKRQADALEDINKRLARIEQLLEAGAPVSAKPKGRAVT